MGENLDEKQLFVRVKGQDLPYDAKVVIYLDTATGNWVVRTPMGAENTADLCAEVLEHFNEMLDNSPPPDDVPLMRMLNQDFH